MLSAGQVNGTAAPPAGTTPTVATDTGLAVSGRKDGCARSEDKADVGTCYSSTPIPSALVAGPSALGVNRFGPFSRLVHPTISPALTSVEPGSATTSGEVGGVSIVHINDIHTYVEGDSDPKNPFPGGLPRFVSAAQKIADENNAMVPRRATVVAIAGDVLTGPYNMGGKWIIESLNKMQEILAKKGVQVVMTLGNHEFDDKVKTVLEMAKFPVLGANFSVDRNGQTQRLTDGTVFMDVGGGRKVVFVGVTTDEHINAKLDNDKIKVTRPADAARAEFERLRGKKFDAVVVVGHLPKNEMRDVIKAAGGVVVDFGITAHAHREFPAEVQASYKDCDVEEITTCTVPAEKRGASFIGRVDIDFGKTGSGRLTSMVLPLTRDVEESPAMLDVIKEAKTIVPKGSFDTKFTMRQATTLETSRRGPSPLGVATTRAMLEMLNTLIPEKQDGVTRGAMLNSGTIRGDLISERDGRVLAGHFDDIFKYDNRLVVVEMSGTEYKKIRAIIDEAIKDGEGGMSLQLEGLPEPKNVKDSDKFQIVTIGYLLDFAKKKIGEKQTFLTKGIIELPKTIRETVASYLSALENPESLAMTYGSH